MSHWYLDGRLFDKDHPQWQKLPGWPLTKAGKPVARLNDGIRLDLGLAPSVTTILKVVGDSGGLLNWMGNLGIQAAIETGGPAMLEDTDAWTGIAKSRMRELRNAASDRGTAFHEAIEKFCLTGQMPEDEAMATACDEISRLPDFDQGNKEWVVEGDVMGDGRVAGTIDHCYLGSQGGLIRDWKTITSDRGHRIDEIAQIAVYRWLASQMLDVGYKDIEAENVYINQQTGRIVNIKRWKEDELEWGLGYFELAYDVFRHELKAPKQ